MTEEQKKKAKELYDEFYRIPYGDMETIILVSQDKDDKNYLKKIKISEYK